MSRHGCLRSLLAVVAIGSTAIVAAAPDAKAQDTRHALRVQESAGLRRFGFPVHARLPKEAMGPNFRLERDGNGVPAQFRKVEAEGQAPYVALDFNVSLGPLESQDFVVEAGPSARQGPEPRGGMNVLLEKGAFRVGNGSVLGYVVPENLDGLFQSVQNVRLEFWNPKERGLFVETAKGDLLKVGGSGTLRGRVSRSGPFAIGLRFDGELPVGAGKNLPTVIEMTFPSSKSWAEVRWSVEDPEGQVHGLLADLGLKVEMSPTVVDLGANATVYGFLRDKDRMTLMAGAGLVANDPSAWQIQKGPPGGLQDFAKSLPGHHLPAEGWAHVIDAMRCSALAIDQFGKVQQTRDLIEVSATGEVLLGRTYPEPGPGPKSLTFWIHFVNNPVQIGAVTSPQAMLAPLVVDWSPTPR